MLDDHDFIEKYRNISRRSLQSDSESDYYDNDFYDNTQNDAVEGKLESYFKTLGFLKLSLN